ncbi:hypothetical protein EsDP_00004884 [Epichloe bromicola]|uniref:SAC3/GANP/THP3 conserved domain-containing protein n=1 Tax=Epichloe bromicola TaxID=79588 RepID=A0ABQ0CT13_9HYPO
MFASFAQGTRGTAPVHNPFAAVPSKGETNPFGGDCTGGQEKHKRKLNNPFQTKDANSSDGGGKQKGKRGRSDGFAKRSQDNNGHGKPRRHDTDQKIGFLHVQTGEDEARATSPSSESSDAANEVTVVPYNSADPLARKVYERLRKDGISPPSWPSQPGNPNNKQIMAKFREQYETYRKNVRMSLTKAGLIDDPEKRKALSDAIEFKGICEDMCPEFEKITRITELDVVPAEKDARTTYADTSKMVKKLARSAAGQEAPLPMDVRSIPSLRRTLDYLLDDLLQNDGNLPVVHGFLWDRTRAIRRDFSFFSSLTPEETKTQAYVLENIARFHVTSLHLLSQEGKAPEDFVQQQELEQLGKALLSLRDVYDDCGEQGIKCENESEFRAYYLLFHARDPSILETLQRQWKPHHWRDSDDVRTAVSLVEALQDTHDFHGPLKDGPSLAASAAFQAYFRIVQDPQVSYTMACFAECHFPQLRRSILQIVKRALSRPKDTAKDVTATALNEFLQFDTVQQAIDFAELHSLEFESNPEDPSDLGSRILILDGRRSLPHRRLQHQYSHNMVERKRSSRPLPDVIHRTVFEDPNAAAPQTNGLGSEGSLSVQDNGFKLQLKPAGFASAGSSTFPNSSSVLSSFKGSALTKSDAPNFQQASNSTPFAAGSAQQAITANGAFASASTSSNSLSSNPFASTGSSTSAFAPKKDSEGKMGAGASGPVSQTTVNPFSVAPETSAKKTIFGDQKPVSSNASSTFPSTFSPTGDSQSTDTPSANGQFSGQKATPPSLSMPPPPIPQTKPPTNFASNSSQNAKPFSTFLPAQNKPTSSLGQTSLPSASQFGSAAVGGLNLARSNDAATAATSSSLKAPVFLGAQQGRSIFTDETSSPAISPLTTVKPTLPTIQPAFTDTAATSLHQSSNPSSGLSAQAAARPASLINAGTSTITTSTEPEPSPVPPRDLMGDFTRWFVKGDNGILEQFQVFIIDDIAGKTFETFRKETAEKRRVEEEARINEEVNRFRTYNLSLKYFYRWKQNAREKRLSTLRRSGRDQLRAFYISQHEAGRKAQKEAAKKAAKERAELTNVNRPEEFMDMLKRKKMSRRQAREALLSSGVLSGATNERDVVESVVQQEFRSRSNSVASSNQSGESLPGPSRKFGAKTKALREMYLGKPGRFRRSLPSTSSRESETPASTRPTSNASATWRLKAMGIEQLPDGTAVPESLAYDMRARPNYYSSLAFGSTLDGSSARRASVSGGNRILGSPIRKMGTPTVEDGLSNNKRKRPSEEEEAEEEKVAGNLTTERSKHKRVMSEAEKLTLELKAIRQELEEGREWFRCQSERLRSESRGLEAAHWFDDSI